MSLAEVYQEALEDKYKYPKGWMANWPPSFDHRLCDVGQISDHMLNTNAVLEDKGINAQVDPDPGSPDGPWDFQSDESIHARVRV